MIRGQKTRSSYLHLLNSVISHPKHDLFSMAPWLELFRRKAVTDADQHVKYLRKTRALCPLRSKWTQYPLHAKCHTKVHLSFKGNFGCCPRASFLRRETGKVVWVPYFDHFQIRINRDIRKAYVTFSGQNKVTKMCPKYLMTRYYKWSSQYQILIKRSGEIKQYTKLSSLYRVCEYECGLYSDCVSNIYG